MRYAVLSTIAVLSLALIAPLAAQAHRSDGTRLKLVLEAPVNFVDADGCPGGAASSRSLRSTSGS